MDDLETCDPIEWARRQLAVAEQVSSDEAGSIPTAEARVLVDAFDRVAEVEADRDRLGVIVEEERKEMTEALRPPNGVGLAGLAQDLRTRAEQAERDLVVAHEVLVLALGRAESDLVRMTMWRDNALDVGDAAVDDILERQESLCDDIYDRATEDAARMADFALDDGGVFGRALRAGAHRPKVSPTGTSSRATCAEPECDDPTAEGTGQWCLFHVHYPEATNEGSSGP